MYVCVCKGVTDKQIEREIQNGAACFDDVQERLGVSLCCGQCKDFTMEVIERADISALAIAV